MYAKLHMKTCRDAALETAAVADPSNHIAGIHDEPAVGEDSFHRRNIQLPMQSKTATMAVLCSTGTETSCKHFLDCSDTSGVVFCEPTHSL